MGTESPRQAGTIEGYKGRGVWVPEGLTAAEIMEGARALELTYDVPHYIASAMAISVLQAAQKQRRGTE